MTTLATKKAAHAAWKRAYRLKYKAEYAAEKIRLLELKRAVKSLPCADCGKTMPPIAMEFDHLPGSDKKHKVSANYLSERSAFVEIGKCEVVCVLCHRNRTHARYRYSNSKTAIRKRALREKVNALKEGPCVVCGNHYSPWQMDFDHMDPTIKVDKVSNLVRKRASYQLVVKEIAKCRLLCALCHRLHTEEQAQNA